MLQDHFHTTHWSVVLAAGKNDTNAKAALASLCETYYAPVLQFVKREIHCDTQRRYGGRDGEDLTHDFFTQLLQGKMFASLQREGARFRVYLLATVRLFLSQVRHRESAQKRGGHLAFAPLPEELGEGGRREAGGRREMLKYQHDDALFDYDWAKSMIRRAVRELGIGNRGEDSYSIPQLLPYLRRELDGEMRRKLAAELKMSDVAVKVALHRLRKKFREIIRKQIAETVSHESEINAELDHLIRALRKA